MTMLETILTCVLTFIVAYYIGSYVTVKKVTSAIMAQFEPYLKKFNKED